MQGWSLTVSVGEESNVKAMVSWAAVLVDFGNNCSLLWYSHVFGSIARSGETDCRNAIGRNGEWGKLETLCSVFRKQQLLSFNHHLLLYGKSGPVLPGILIRHPPKKRHKSGFLHCLTTFEYLLLIFKKL